MILQCDKTKDYQYNIEYCTIVLIVFGFKHHFHLFIYLLTIYQEVSTLCKGWRNLYSLWVPQTHKLIYFRPSPLFIGPRQTKFPGNAVFFLARAPLQMQISPSAVMQCCCFCFVHHGPQSIYISWTINHGTIGIEYDRRTIVSAITWSSISSFIINDSWIQSSFLCSHRR